MQLDKQRIYIKDPSAETVNNITTGEFAGELHLDGQIQILNASVTQCDIQCASPCVPQINRVTFSDVDFGDCNDCGKSVGFKVRLQRNPDFDNQTYLDYSQVYSFVYQGTKSGVVTGAELATYFEEYIAQLQDQPDQHDVFLGQVEVDPADSTAILITLPCDGLVTYEFQGIYQLEDNNLTAAELPVFAVDQEAEDAYYSRERMLQHAPLMAGHVFGEYPKEFFTWCESSCVIQLQGCIDPCTQPYEYPNSGHLHTGATPFDLEIVVNSSFPTYAEFITALNAALAPCDLTTAPGVEGTAIQAEIAGGTAVLDITDLDFGDGTNNYTLSNGATTLTVFDVTDGADLQAKLTAAFPSGTFAFVAGPPAELTVSGDFVSTASGTAITLAQVLPPFISGE